MGGNWDTTGCVGTSASGATPDRTETPDRTVTQDRAGTVVARVTSWVAILLGVALLVGGLAWWWLQPGRPAGAQGQQVPVPPSASGNTNSDQGEASTSVPTPVRAPWRAGAPRRVVIPALAVDVPVIPIKAPGGELTPPSDPQELGWWADGARPGAARGSALITGHTVHTGGGALDELHTMKPGEPVSVTTDRGRIRYRVTRVVDYGKGELARNAQRIFSQEVKGRLVLITCSDWNGVEYLSNTVVTATPVGGA